MSENREYMSMEKHVNGFKITFEFPEKSYHTAQIEQEIKEVLVEELKTKIKELGM